MGLPKNKKADATAADSQTFDSDEALLRAGMTKEQILAGRARNALEQMQRDMFVAQLIVLSGAQEWKKMFPDTSPEALGEWAVATLAAARAGLPAAKQ